MVALCFVPMCPSGLRSEKRNRKEGERISLFTIPNKKNEELFRKWQRKIPRDGFKITDTVCEKHFIENDIIRYHETILKDGNVFRMDLYRPRLKSDAVPRIFPNLPKYLSNTKPPRKPPTPRTAPVFSKRSRKRKNDSYSGDISFDSNKHQDNNLKDSPIPVITSVFSKALSNQNVSTDYGSLKCEELQPYDYAALLEDIEKIKTDWTEWFWNEITAQGEKQLFFCHIGPSAFPDKFIKIKTDLSVEGLFGEHSKAIPIPVSVIRNKADLLSVMNSVTEYKFVLGPLKVIKKLYIL